MIFMSDITLYKPENFIDEKKNEPYVIVGAPCDRLLELQNAGYCVLAELVHLQGLSDEEVAEALCREEAVTRYTNVCIDAGALSQGYLRRIWCRHRKIPVVVAETERLLIRESVEDDGEAFWKLYQDPACQEFLEALPVEEQSVEAYRRYIAQYKSGQYAFYEYGMWSAIEKVSGRCIGRAGLEQQNLPEGNLGLGLGYALLPEYRGKGYATEACQAILEYCRECDYADEVYVMVGEANDASRKVYRKLKEHRTMKLNLVSK